MLSRLVGNAPLKDGVAAMLRQKRMTHSLLLCGEAGVGARFAARAIAADYLYPTGGAGAQALLRGECCRALAGKTGDKVGSIETGIVREAILIEGEGKADKIKISQIRAVRREIVNSSLSAAGRVVLLYGAEKMQAEAANALLKILEEPPEGVLFILTASSLAAVMPTIRSRCVGFALSPPPPDECAAFCAKNGVKAPEAARLSAIYNGHIGTVLAVAKTPKRKANLEIAQKLAAAAHKGDAYTAGALLVPFEKDKAALAVFLGDFIAFVGAGLYGTAPDTLHGRAAARAIRAAGVLQTQIAANVNTKAALTLFAIRLGKVNTAV